MGIDLFQLSNIDERNCEPCGPDTCKPLDGCSKLVAVAPCEVLYNPDGTIVQPEAMFFGDPWCRVKSLEDFNYSPNQTVTAKGYVGEKFETQRFGRSRPTMTIDVTFCKSEDSHIQLQNTCYLAVMTMDDRTQFNPALPASQLPCVRYGMYSVLPPDESSQFDVDQIRSYSLAVHQIMFERNMGGVVVAPVTAQVLEQKPLKDIK